MVSSTSGAPASGPATDLIFNRPTSAGSADSFAKELISELQGFLDHSGNGSHPQIDIQSGPGQNSGARQFLVTVSGTRAPAAATSTPAAGNSDPSSDRAGDPQFQSTVAFGQLNPTLVPTLAAREAADQESMRNPYLSSPMFLANRRSVLLMEREGNPEVFDANANLTPTQQTVMLYRQLYPDSPEAKMDLQVLLKMYAGTDIPNNETPASILAS